MAIQAGKAREIDSYPYYRFVPPTKFREWSRLGNRPWGRFGYPAPAYQSPPQPNCPNCVSGFGAYYATNEPALGAYYATHEPALGDTTVTLTKRELVVKVMSAGILSGIIGIGLGIIIVPLSREIADALDEAREG